MSLYNKVIDLQKLTSAWQRVCRNKPAAGVDSVTWQQFDENSKEELRSLKAELENHSYKPLPVRNVTLYKGEKARTIALYAMRDKVVQQSLAQELTKLFDGRFSSQTYAYRSEKSALQAIEDITAKIATRAYGAVLKTDITHFFDTIRWELLQKKLASVIKENDVMQLIHANACTAMLDETTGEIAEKTVGIHQGSSIAPVLSNIFLMDFDNVFSRIGIFYVRYSDDILVLGESKEKLHELFNELNVRLEELGLSANKDKTVCCTLSEGVTFLGYHLDATGKSIPAKAEEHLYDRLETMWLTSPNLDIEEKAAKALEIVGGWQQYFRGERKMQSIYEFIAFVSAVGGKAEMREKLEHDRRCLENVCRDIAEYLALFWKKYDRKELELLEYEQIFNTVTNRPSITEDKIERLLSVYRKHIVLESEETATELMQIYTDMQEYNHAQHWMEQLERLQARKSRLASISRQTGFSGNLEGTPFQVTSRTPSLMLDAFAGREDIYSTESFSSQGKRKSELKERPLTETQMEDHLRGGNTYGTYILRPNSTVRYIVWDVDISKQFLLKNGNQGEAFDACLQRAYHKALEIQKLLEDKGIHAYIEFSGFRGYHVWLFLTEWIPIRFANMLTDRIEEELAEDTDITVECFPNKVRLKPGRFGQVIKLPFGIHVRSNRRSCFLDDDGQPVTSIDHFIETRARYPLPTIRKVLTFVKSPTDATNSGEGGTAVPSVEEGLAQSVISEEVMEQELQAAYGELTASVKEVLSHCSLMKYLCLKAKRTGYLTHFERMSILYVFGHIGEEGKEFVHEVMRLTMNYQYNTTQRFIERIPEKPISCGKLREQYKKISAEVGCNCSFKRTKNCYPSPVLHALSLSKDVQEDITVPTSRSLSSEKEKTVIEELNVHKKAQELAARVLELRKQQRALDKSVSKTERELEKLYDSVGTDALEIEMGLLVRRKKEEGYEWIIEI